jgi:hypothetical protein
MAIHLVDTPTYLHDPTKASEHERAINAALLIVSFAATG